MYFFFLCLCSETHDQVPQPTQPSAQAATQAVGTSAVQAPAVGTSTAQDVGAGTSAAAQANAHAAGAQPVGTTDAQDIGTNRKLTSVVWNHFKREKIDGEWKAICNYCRKKLSGKGSHGTTHLHDHYKACMPRKTKDIRQSILNPRQQKKEGPVSLGAHTFDQTVSRAELAKMVILHEYPLNMVEHFGFRSFVNSVNPLFKHMSRTTLKSDIKDIFDKEKMKLKKILSTNQGRVAVTTDMWTASNQKRGYMVVIAHYT